MQMYPKLSRIAVNNILSMGTLGLPPVLGKNAQYQPLAVAQPHPPGTSMAKPCTTPYHNKGGAAIQ